MPRLCHHTGFGRADLRRILSGPDYARIYRGRALWSGVEIYTNTTITGWQGRSQVIYTSPAGLGSVQCKALLLATGVRERPRPARLIPGSRPLGIFTTGSLQRFVYQEHLPVGKQAVIVGAELVSLSALLTLVHAGVKVKMMVTELPAHQIYFPYLPMKWALADLLTRTPVLTRTRVINIFGRKRLEGLEITQLDTGGRELIDCDTVIFTGDWVPEHEIARRGGLSMDPGTRGPTVDGEFRSSIRGVFAAGNLLRGVATADDCALEGKRAGTSIAAFLQDQKWPERSVAIQIGAPLAWICPNRIPLVESISPIRFGFRSGEFRDRVQIEVRQGEHLLHTELFRHLIVNEIMQLSC